MIADVPAIVARDMGVRRRGRWLLRPADFGIAEGVIGLAGPPGTGKSTLLATFATLRRPQSGMLEVLGYDTENVTVLRSLRARIGYLPDRFRWAENLTVRDFVAYAAYYKCSPPNAAAGVLEGMGLGESASHQMALLPPDVRLRAGLAATCVHEPELVLLDEPFQGLDERAVAELIPILRTLARTVIVTASEPASLTGWCDRVLTLTRGRLVDLPAGGLRPAGNDPGAGTCPPRAFTATLRPAGSRHTHAKRHAGV